MSEEAAFLKQLTDDPDDLATLLVYADWLEDQGATDRAEFLRLQQQVLAMRHRQKGFLAASRRLLALGKKLDPAWLAVVSRPRLLDTHWVSTDTDGDEVEWWFLADGVLDEADSDSIWVQIGNHVAMSVENHVAEWEGFVAGDRIQGTAKNVDDHTWRWKATLQSR